MRDVSTGRHTWIMSFLYIGTFGSFIGFSFAFGQVLQVQFAEQFDTPIKAASLTFLGPLIGSLIRPVGGRLADRFGGARVTIVNFVGMAAGAGAGARRLDRRVAAAVHRRLHRPVHDERAGQRVDLQDDPGHLHRPRPPATSPRGADMEAEARDARRLSRALIGIAGSVGAFGGVFVNLAPAPVVPVERLGRRRLRGRSSPSTSCAWP